MSHRNSAHAKTLKSQLALVSRLVNARAILVLVLVLLITNGGAG